MVDAGPYGDRLEKMMRSLARTLDRRFWLVAAATTVVALLALGVPTAVVPNPFFLRMTPTEPFNVAVWLLSAPLIGLVTAASLVPVREPHGRPAAQSGRATLAGVGAYLAIGCPICNKIVVAALGVSGALNVFAPIQPLIGGGSVLLLGATAAWMLRRRARGCERCAPMAAVAPARP